MTRLRIKDAPLIETSVIQEDLKIPTGGYGDKTINLIQISSWLMKYKNIATKEYVNTVVSELSETFATKEYVVEKVKEMIEPLPDKGYVDTKFSTLSESINRHLQDFNNPHKVSKNNIGLGNVDNTSDKDKPLSIAATNALSNKTDKTYVDEKFKYVEDNGAALPWVSDVEYPEGAVVVKDGVLVQKKGDKWVSVAFDKNASQKLQKAATVNAGLGYSKRLIANIPFKYPDFDKYSQIFGQYNCFPQGFTFDPKNNHIYISINSNRINTFAVWDVSDPKNLNMLTIFKIDDSTYGNEGLIVKHEDGRRNMYFRTNTNMLHKLDITTLPDAGSIIPISKTVNTGMPTAENFGAYGDYFVVSATQATVGSGTVTRGNYTVYNKDYNVVDNVQMQGASAGAGHSAPYADILPKIQGFGMTLGGFVGSSGGAPTGINTYTNFGTITWDMSGNMTSQNLVSSDALAFYVENDLGETPHYCEAEGIYTDDAGRVYTLVLYNNEKTQVGADRGGILIFEEFSTHPDAYDFSDYAARPPSAGFVHSGLYPLSYFRDRTSGDLVRAYFNPYTGSAFKDWYEICSYMISSEVSEFTYYNNAPATEKIKDLNGADIPPSSGLVTIKNCNTNTFLVVCETVADGVYRYRLQYDTKTQDSPRNTVNSIFSIEYNTPTVEFVTGNHKCSLGINQQGRFGLFDNRKGGLWMFHRDESGGLFLGTHTTVHGKITTSGASIKGVKVFQDNATAKAGGLIDGDVYRTSTGQLMIVY